MFSKMARKGLHRIVRALDRLAFADDQEGVPGENFAYRELNARLLALVHQESGIRPSYAWGTLHAVHLARNLGIDHVSVLEFGVATGGGLLSLERIAERVGDMFQARVDVYGFDTGTGLPPPLDYRDSPNIYHQHGFRMDVDRLQAALRKAHLLLGLVEDTVSAFLRANPAPIGFISFDLDYYSSTTHALKVLVASSERLLPRVHCYFDDINGFTHSEYTGERLAIAEFNASQSRRKVAPIHALRYYLPTAFRSSQWPDCMYMAHVFDHPLYTVPDGLTRLGGVGRPEPRAQVGRSVTSGPSGHTA